MAPFGTTSSRGRTLDADSPPPLSHPPFTSKRRNLAALLQEKIMARQSPSTGHCQPPCHCIGATTPAARHRHLQTVSYIGRALPRPASTSAEQTRIESIHEDRKPGSEVGFPPTFHQ